MRVGFYSIVLGISLIFLAISPGFAAVRKCYAEISSGMQEAASEAEARKRALAAWMAEARKLGPGLNAWRIAFKKELACGKADRGLYICIARGRPCTILQKPPAPAPSGKQRNA